jgi:hypothetical protein
LFQVSEAVGTVAVVVGVVTVAVLATEVVLVTVTVMVVPPMVTETDVGPVWAAVLLTIADTETPPVTAWTATVLVSVGTVTAGAVGTTVGVTVGGTVTGGVVTRAVGVATGVVGVVTGVVGVATGVVTGVVTGAVGVTVGVTVAPMGATARTVVPPVSRQAVSLPSTVRTIRKWCEMKTTWPRSKSGRLKLWCDQKPNWWPKPRKALSSSSDRIRPKPNPPDPRDPEKPFMAEFSIGPNPFSPKPNWNAASWTVVGRAEWCVSATPPATPPATTRAPAAAVSFQVDERPSYRL